VSLGFLGEALERGEEFKPAAEGDGRAVIAAQLTRGGIVLQQSELELESEHGLSVVSWLRKDIAQ
jgi:hypothetical protein